MKKKGIFWVMEEDGNVIQRDLEKENKHFVWEEYAKGNYDALNYVWYENFDYYTHESIGCDYERLGCYIRKGDTVLDIGANLGVFERRARFREAGRVICFEPITPTYNCLIKNVDIKTQTFKMGISGKSGFMDFEVPVNFTHVGGGANSNLNLNSSREVVYRETSYCLGINELFESGLFDKIDFMKVDCEGGEYEIFENIEDRHLDNIRCIAIELHASIKDGSDMFQENLLRRFSILGFQHFTLYHGDGGLRTINAWRL
jgi:FkbM family methyltransferase